MIPKQDRIRPRTVEDLERMYKFGKRNEEMRGFATKQEIESVRDDIPDVSKFATTEEVKKKVEEVGSKIPTLTSQLTNDSGFATTGQIPDVSEFATENFVRNEIAQAQLGGDDSDIDLSGFATKDEVNEVKGKIPDTTNLATKDEVKNVENKIPDISNLATKDEVEGVEDKVDAIKIPDTSNFLTSEEIQQLINQVIVQAIKQVESKIPDTSNLATKDEVSRVENKIPDTSNLATKEEVSNVEDRIPDTSNLATKQEVSNVENKIPDTSNLATKGEVQNVENKIPDTSNLATKEEVQDVEDKIPDTSGFVTEEQVKGYIKEALLESGGSITPDYSQGSVIYKGSGEERRAYFTINEKFLAVNGSLYIDDLGVSAVGAYGDVEGASFPLLISSSEDILEIVLVTRYNHQLITPSQGNLYLDGGTWVWTPFEGQSTSSVVIFCDTHEDTSCWDEIVQLMVITR